MNSEIIHNPTTDAIIARRSIRAYTSVQLSDVQLNTLLTCALWSPSGRNSQPCHVRALQGFAALDEMNADFKETVGHDTPAYSRWDTNPVYQTAPTLILIFSDSDSYAPADSGIMAENICIAAESIGLGSCIIASVGALFDGKFASKWKNRLDIPESYRFLLAVAVGNKAEQPEPKSRDESHFKVIG